MASALVLGACSAGEVSRSAAGASEAALLPSEAASSAIASAEASSEAAPDEVTGPPQAPVAASWRGVAPHQVQWSVWTPKTDTIAAVEAVITTSGTGQTVPCSPDAESSTQSRSFWSCTLLGRQGPQTARVRAVNPSGTSPWTEVQVTFNRGSCTDAVAAAGLAAAYRGGGKTDWFLASKDELSKMRDRRTEIGGLATKDSFWSSSQYDNSIPDGDISAWEDVLDDKDAGGQLDGGFKYMPNRVRPIRAF